MTQNTTEKQTRYKPNQIGYLSQELLKTLNKARPNKTEQEVLIIDEISSIIASSFYGVSDSSIDLINRLLKDYQGQVKKAQIEKLELELNKLKGN